MERSATLTSDYFAWTAEVALPTGLGGHNRLWHAYFDDRTLATCSPTSPPPSPIPRPSPVATTTSPLPPGHAGGTRSPG
ncbi:hypothetical protein NKH18_47975 [Streptomyces sp. M10(2022)]